MLGVCTCRPQQGKTERCRHTGPESRGGGATLAPTWEGPKLGLRALRVRACPPGSTHLLKDRGSREAGAVGLSPASCSPPRAKGPEGGSCTPATPPPARSQHTLGEPGPPPAAPPRTPEQGRSGALLLGAGLLRGRDFVGRGFVRAGLLQGRGFWQGRALSGAGLWRGLGLWQGGLIGVP